MKKREPIDTFLGGLNEIRDQLTVIEATLDQGLMVRTTLNAVSEDWEVFVQNILEVICPEYTGQRDTSTLG